MNFITLSFLFPILVIASLLLCPIDTVAMGYRTVVGFFSAPMKAFSISERIGSFVTATSVFMLANLARRLRQIGNVVKLVASWLVVLTILVTLAAPAYALGTAWGIAKFLVGGVIDTAKDVRDSVEDGLSDLTEAACAPAGRSIR